MTDLINQSNQNLNNNLTTEQNAIQNIEQQNKQHVLSRVRMEEGWKNALSDILTSDTMNNLRQFLRTELSAGKEIYPPNPQIFRAFELTPLSKVRVVILGQDPYHGAGQANGLAFSVPRGLPLPPSLRNILHELSTDLATDLTKTPSKHGDLSAWAEQGVLLLNSVLTVEAGQPTSHQKRGWELFTDTVIEVISKQCDHCVFILWGSYAHKKGLHIDERKHLVLKAAHPSPLSANRGGFFGCKVFSKTNSYLQKHQLPMIDWTLN